MGPYLIADSTAMTTPTFKACLNEWNAEVLKEFAKQLGVHRSKHTRKQHFIDAINAVLTQTPEAFIARLGKNEKILLAETLYGGELPSEQVFMAKHGVARPQISDRGYGSGRRAALVSCVLSFERYTNEVIVFPSLVSRLKPLVPEPDPPRARPMTDPPEMHEGQYVRTYSGERFVELELKRVLRHVGLGKTRVTKGSGRPTDASTRALGEALVEPDFSLDPPEDKRDRFTDLAGPVRAHAWGVLVQQCGWAKAKGGTLALTPSGKKMLSSFSPEAFRAGFDSFLADEKFDELHRVNHLRGQTGKAKRGLLSVASRRFDFVDHAHLLPPGEWLDFDEAFRLLEASGGCPGIYKSARAFLYLDEARYGAIYDSRPVDRQFLRALFMESLATLGILDIAYVQPHHLWPELDAAWGAEIHSFLGRYDGLVAVRLNDWGAYCLELTDSYTAAAKEESPGLQILPNHEIAVPGEPDPGDLALLELIAVRISDHVWKLDKSTLLQSLESGAQFQEIRELLSAASHNEIPANIAQWLGELEEKAFSCKGAHRAIVLSWRNREQAATIANSAGTAKLCQHLGDHRILLLEKDRNAFASAARKQGFLIPGS